MHPHNYAALMHKYGIFFHKESFFLHFISVMHEKLHIYA